MNKDFWHGRRVFITGHTGFKGSWMSLWLQQMGAQVTGFALPCETQPSMFTLAQVGRGMQSIEGDVRDLDAVKKAVLVAQPEIVIHMAAQALVRTSYADPVETYATNVMGTVHLLEAARTCQSVRAVVNVTTDKCYENHEWVWPYRENDELGGHDPYSSSKACSELVTQAYVRSYPELGAGGRLAVATARAGNVIGGGDGSVDRLIPDVVSAWRSERILQIRSPLAVRPWQFVLDPLHGYLQLAERLYKHGQAFAGAWNFGPNSNDARPVQWLVEQLAKHWGPAARWAVLGGERVHEATTLKLDCSKARAQLGWYPVMNLGQGLEQTMLWYRTWLGGGNLSTLSQRQITEFQERVVQS